MYGKLQGVNLTAETIQTYKCDLALLYLKDNSI